MQVGRSSPAGGARAGYACPPSLSPPLRLHYVRRVLRDGRSLPGKRVVLCFAPGPGRTAVVVARRIGGAVERNRARRILRAAWREAAPQAEDGYDVVLVARQAIRGAKTQDLVADMTELLRRAGVTRA